MSRILIAVAVALAAPPIDLSDYRTVDTAQKATEKSGSAGAGGLTGYLGASVTRDNDGRLVVEAVQPDSPAAKAGLHSGDVLTHVGDQVVRSTDSFREWVQSHGPNEAVTLTVIRDGQPRTLTATLTATSRPMRIGPVRVYLGLELGANREGSEGVPVRRVAPESPAAAAGIKPGDLITKLDGGEFNRPALLADLLSTKQPGETIPFTLLREGHEVQVAPKLDADRGSSPRNSARPAVDSAPTTAWTKGRFRLAVIGIEFEDIKHNGGVSVERWHDAFLSRDKLRGLNPITGTLSFGSLADYVHEVSAGALKLEGRVFRWVPVNKRRADYVQGSGVSNKLALLTDAIAKFGEYEGKDTLKGFDGIAFLYAGERHPTNRGAIYYPHAGTVLVGARRVPYMIVMEGGAKPTPLGGFVKEFGRMLGLPDLAARPENQGSEGLGPWCAMSNPFPSTRPQHYCAWCKTRLGWLKPTVIDPTVRQKLILGPVEKSSKECVKILVRPDGSEYFLLENRTKTGFDSDLPAEGLLIWRVVHDRPSLEEAHGIDGPSGPTSHLTLVPFPSATGNSFTPDTTPSSRSPQGGGLPVQLTQIRRLPDGRIAFQIGYEFR